MKIPGFVKKLFLVFIVVLIGAGVFVWKEVLPVMAELKDKNPEKFAQLIEEAKSLHVEEAKQLFLELEQMTYEAVLTYRYNSWKKKKEDDRKFRLGHWEKEWELREEARQAKKKKRQQQVNELVGLSEERKGNVLFLDWQKAGSWERGLLLREKCIKYLEIENEQGRRRKNLRKLPGMTRLLKGVGEEALTIPELCEDLVPISHDEREVIVALEKLKNKMNYFFFVQLLDEVGVPRQDVFSLPAQLNRMTGGLADS